MGEEQTSSMSKPAAACLVLLMAAAGVLWSMGRTWWCACGSPIPWSWNIWSSHNSQHLIDPYTFTHVLHGIFFYAGLRFLLPRSASQTRWVIAVAIEVCWEILENSPMIIDRYRAATISLDYYGDSIANSIFDVVACAIGYLAAAAVRWWWSLGLIVVIEVGLLLTIRDCLTLNIIMLVCPLEEIKAWQMS